MTDRTDWNRLRTLPEGEIERMAANDGDNPATLSEDEWSNAVVGAPLPKTPIHASFDSDVVAFFKRGGRGYQMRMNAVLRRYMELHLKNEDGR
ncbi:BrnA antitoxin family protein [Methylobacterium sp. Leaf466]|uniref:BrnA antitoxin family protein n=1 Tax=Methylobacterium sp. Leaf466 TaxID=1736386 RepID=UPI000B26499A|nr:BrnA antitoxin family protein [Methylobacterium sp. Leaf466]